MIRRSFETPRQVSRPQRHFVLVIAGVFFLLLSAHLPSSAAASAQVKQKAAGAEIFATVGCTHCHGIEGQGTDSGPDLRSLRKRLSAQQTEHQIEAGGQAMPAFGSSLTQPQIQQLVAFLRAKS
ncbi:MAG: c-type cytochrome [Janthinobacterium lividum]